MNNYFLYNISSMEPSEIPTEKKPSFFLIITQLNNATISPNSKSEPSQTLPNPLSQQKDNHFKYLFGKLNKWRSRLSVPQSTLHSKVQSQAYISSPKTRQNSSQLKKHQKSQVGVIHDRFMQFLLRKSKKFGNGLNTVIIKKKQPQQKNGLGELASKLAIIKPLAVNQIEHQKTKNYRFQWRSQHSNKTSFKNQQKSVEQAREKIQLWDDFSQWKYNRNSIKNARLGISFKKKSIALQPWQQREQNIFNTMEAKFNRTPLCSFSDIPD